MERHAKLENIMKDMKGLKNISEVKTRKKQKMITSATDTEGHTHTDRQSIADIFADFYAELYSSKFPRTSLQQAHTHENLSPIQPFTNNEVSAEIKNLKNNKTEGSDSIIAELTKHGGTKLVQILTDMFNEILSGSASIPSRWKETIIKVLYKSGDERLPQNYRPIAIIPMLYKLFSRLIYTRLRPTLEREQCADQAGFRKGFNTVDHLFTWTQLHEKCREHQLPLWIVSLDFKKAFDTIEHEGLWTALLEQGVQLGYVRLIQQLYAGQSGRVKTDKTSKAFNIERGTKQGDPLS